MVPILNSLGDIIPTSARKGKPYKEQRIKIELATEYILSEHDEIVDFLETFCVNFASFNYMDYMRVTEQRKKDEMNMTIDNLNTFKNGKNKIRETGVSDNGSEDGKSNTGKIVELKKSK